MRTSRSIHFQTFTFGLAADFPRNASWNHGFVRIAAGDCRCDFQGLVRCNPRFGDMFPWGCECQFQGLPTPFARFANLCCDASTNRRQSLEAVQKTVLFLPELFLPELFLPELRGNLPANISAFPFTSITAWHGTCHGRRDPQGTHERHGRCI